MPLPMLDKNTADLNIIAPHVHTGGTSRTALARDYGAALRAVGEALNALAETCPNGRDYYCHAEPDAMARAVREHQSREARLLAVYAELGALWNAVDE